MESDDPKLDELIGEQVSAVSFVMDYSEIHFNGPLLRVLSDPLVILSQLDAAAAGNSPRDRLCALIRREVVKTLVTADEIRIYFTGDAILRVPRWSLVAGPESVHYMPAQPPLRIDRRNTWYLPNNCPEPPPL